MRYLLQRPLPDELLSSVWVRTARHSGLPIATVTRSLTNGRKWAPGFLNASHLLQLAPLLQMSGTELLWRHTVFPYTTAFFEASLFGKVLNTALTTGVSAVAMGAVTQGVSDRVPLRRVCPECIRSDQRTWGESYWHRSHALPGVAICVRHERPLQVSELRSTGTNDWSYTLPHELKATRRAHRRVSPFQVELSKRSVNTLGRDFGTQNERPSLWYRTAMMNQGLLSQGFQVNAEKLIGWAAGLINVPGTRLDLSDSEKDLHWLALMVRPRSGVPVVPLKHLIFETALSLAGQVHSPVVDHVSLGRPVQTTHPADGEYAGALRALIRQYIQRGDRVRVCDALSEAACWQAFRHDRTRFPRLAREVQRLRSSAASVRPLRATAISADVVANESSAKAPSGLEPFAVRSLKSANSAPNRDDIQSTVNSFAGR